MHWIILIFCFIIGFVALYYGLKLLRLRGRVKRWELVKAIVTDKKVIDKKLASAGSRANKTISINYSYNFNAQHYQGNRVFFVELIKGEKDFSPEDAEKFLKKIGNEINVHVNPNQPSESVIYTDGTSMYIFMIVIGFGLLLGALGYLLSL